MKMTIAKNVISRGAAVLMVLCSLHTHAQLWWGDEFNDGYLNTSNWNIDVAGGGFGNNELQYYTNRWENVRVADNCLQLTARQENYNGHAYTSGKITSYGKRHWGSGWIEGRMSIPMGNGFWPAFWMLGVNIGSVGWPACGEIDIMEHINWENTVHGTIHWAGYGGEHWSYGGSVSTSPSGWHNYQINWNQYSIKWYVDGALYHTANITSNINSTEEFHRDFFLILNFAVGGNWPGWNIDNSRLPATLYVDYVRVYQPSYSARVGAEEEAFVQELEQERGEGVLIYPNPVSAGSELTVKVKDYNPSALVNVAFIDMNGKVVLNKTDNRGEFKFASGDQLTSGAYHVKITNGTNSYTKKVVIH